MEAAADRLQSLLDKARADLEVRGRRDAAWGCRLRCAFAHRARIVKFVAERLANEFDAAYSEHGVNPLRLLARIGKLQDGLWELQAECDEVLAARQDLVEVARLKILADRRALCNMQARAGLLVSSDDEDSAYQGLYQVLQACEQRADLNELDFKYCQSGTCPFPGSTVVVMAFLSECSEISTLGLHSLRWFTPHRTTPHHEHGARRGHTMGMCKWQCGAQTCVLALGKMFQKRSVSSPAPVTMGIQSV
eukprot:SM000020S06061  [mRNA]  locus=s20:859702:861825:+ [translate_table: standard]